MAARAIWKGVISFGAAEVPVKLYSAVTDKSIHFRLLHEKDLAPVRQQMVDPESGDPVPPEEISKAYPTSRSRLVLLEEEDLEKVEPKPSREIEVTRFVDPEQIDHRWYERPYYLGPDGSTAAYFALAKALSGKGREGVARWVMRNRSYIGALRAEGEHLMLITLRNAEEVIVADQLAPPAGRDLSKREIQMAGQLVESLSGKFDPTDYRDEYRDRVLELIATKGRGERVKVRKFRPRPAEESLDEALAASLAATGKKRAAGGR